jgi:hypothetical protein
MFVHSRGTGYGDNVGARAKRCLSKIAHLVGPVVGQNALPEMTRLILKRHALKRLFDHLVGAQEERFWDRQTKNLGGRKIEDEIELGRLLDREVGRLRPA